jgi:hypothetical protein
MKLHNVICPRGRVKLPNSSYNFVSRILERLTVIHEDLLDQDVKRPEPQMSFRSKITKRRRCVNKFHRVWMDT